MTVSKRDSVNHLDDVISQSACSSVTRSPTAISLLFIKLKDREKVRKFHHRAKKKTSCSLIDIRRKITTTVQIDQQCIFFVYELEKEHDCHRVLQLPLL